jgi:hypothetical protein
MYVNYLYHKEGRLKPRNIYSTTMFNLQRLLHTETGRMFISMLLGLGLAALFRGKCTDKTCIGFKGPVIDQVTGKVYKFGDAECSKFKLVPVQHDTSKKIVDLPSNEGAEPNGDPHADVGSEEYVSSQINAEKFGTIHSGTETHLTPNGQISLPLFSGVPYH